MQRLCTPPKSACFPGGGGRLAGEDRLSIQRSSYESAVVLRGLVADCTRSRGTEAETSISRGRQARRTRRSQSGPVPPLRLLPPRLKQECKGASVGATRKCRTASRQAPNQTISPIRWFRFVKDLCHTPNLAQASLANQIPNPPVVSASKASHLQGRRPSSKPRQESRKKRERCPKNGEGVDVDRRAFPGPSSSGRERVGARRRLRCGPGGGVGGLWGRGTGGRRGLMDF